MGDKDYKHLVRLLANKSVYNQHILENNKDFSEIIHKLAIKVQSVALYISNNFSW